MTFKHGKYKGQSFESILINDPEYIEYLYFDLNGGQEPTFKSWFHCHIMKIISKHSRRDGETLEEITECNPALICYLYDTVNDVDPLFIKWFDSQSVKLRKNARRNHQELWSEYDKIKKEIGGM